MKKWNVERRLPVAGLRIGSDYTPISTLVRKPSAFQERLRPSAGKLACPHLPGGGIMKEWHNVRMVYR